MSYLKKNRLQCWLKYMVYIPVVGALSVAVNAKEYDLQAKSLTKSLLEFSEASDVQIIVPPVGLEGVQSSGLQGDFSIEQGLSFLLKDSGMTFRKDNNNVFVVYPDPALNSKEGDSKSNNSVDPKSSIELEEVIVTASKRGKGLSVQDTAMAISALGGDTIEKRGLVGMDDYLQTLPGVSFQDRGAGQNQIVIRGMVSEPQGDDPSAGVYFGETPITGLGSPNNDGGGGNADIKLVDIERIEVLRGPQGTLYGAGSMGGTVRIIPASPNLQQVEGKVAARYSQTGNQGGDNRMVQGVVNLPLVEDTLAIRAVAYRFDNSGYINNVAASQPILGISSAVAASGVAQDRGDVGADEYTGFRLTTLWQPLDELSFTLTYLQQKIEQDGIPEVNTTLAGSYQQSRLNTNVDGSGYESLQNEVNITNLIVNYDFGWGALTNSASWTDYEATVEADISHVLFAPYYAPNNTDQDIFVEELRFTSQFEGPLQFLVGFYYEDNKENFLGFWSWSGDPLLDTGPFLENDVRWTNDQKAFFGEVSYQITDQLMVTVGARYFDYERTQFQDASLLGTKVIDNVFLVKSQTGNTLKANLTWAPNEDFLMYGQWAEGFRLGRPTRKPIPLCDANNDGLLDDTGFAAPDGLESDTTENYEIGVKTSLLDNRVTVNAAVYHIDWQGIPVFIGLPSCNDGVRLNAGESKSEGVELEIQTRLSESVQFDFSTSYGEATLTEDAPNIGNKGDNLPGSADFNLSAGLQYEFVMAGYSSFARIDYSYIDEYYHNVAEIGLASGGYSQIHLKAGMNINNVDIDLFINNLTDADDFTWVESTWAVNRAYRLRPRTVGFNIGYHF